MELTFNFGDFLARTKSMIRKPDKEFDKILKEKGLKKALSYYIILTLVSVVIGISLAYVLIPLIAPLFPDGTFAAVDSLSVEGLINILMIYLVDVLLGFLVAGILFIWLKIFKGNGPYSQAYRLFAYTQAPNMLLRSFPYLSLVGWLYSMYLLILGTIKMYKVKKVVAALMYIVPLAIMFFLVSSYVPTV